MEEERLRAEQATKLDPEIEEHIDEDSEFDTENSDICDDSDLEMHERDERYKIRKMRRGNRNFQKMLAQIRDPNAKRFRRCLRKVNDRDGNKTDTNKMLIPMDQIKENFILAQSVEQCEAIYNSTVLSIDQLHSK